MWDAVCLASGGLDSSVCLALSKRDGLRVLPIFIDYGQINCEPEYQSLVDNCERLMVPRPVRLNFSDFGKVVPTGLTDPGRAVVADAFTPCRNLLFLVTAAAVAHNRAASTIIMGLLHEATALFPDQSDNFLRAAEHSIFEALGSQISIVTPLRDLRKSEVVALAYELGVKSYYSCHAGTDPPCGECIACREYGGIDNGR